jgi:hypothetical protein
VNLIDSDYVKENSFGGIADPNEIVLQMSEKDRRLFIDGGGLLKQKTAYGLVYERIIPIEYSEISNDKRFKFLSVNSLFSFSKKKCYEINNIQKSN